MADWWEEFVFMDRRWFPHQRLILLATLDSPGCLTIPYLIWNENVAVFPFWTLLKKDPERTILLNSLKRGDIDEFLYQTCVMETEKELWSFSAEIDEIAKLQTSLDSESRAEAAERLKGLQQALTRFHVSLAQNQQYEDGLVRALSVGLTKSRHRSEFKRLAAWAGELDRSLKSAFDRSMLIRMTAGAEESRQEVKMLSERLASTNEHAHALTHLAFVYVPLTFAAGMIGMSLKDTHGSKVAFSVFGALAIAIAYAAFSLATGCRVVEEVWGRKEADPWML